jgi:hypothetical protein
MGGTLVSVGELDAARDHFEAALAAGDTRQVQWSALGSDLRVFAHGWYSHALWLLGEDVAAQYQAEQAIALARARDHAYSLTLAFAYAALLHQMRRDTDKVVECASRVVELCDRYEFAYYGDWARVLVGWADGQTYPQAGIAAIETALGRLDSRRAQARRPYYLSLLAETCGRAGERERAAAILTAAVAMARERGDAWWLPALYLQQSEYEAAPAAAATRQRALDLARLQHSRSLEQRILSWSSAPPPG